MCTECAPVLPVKNAIINLDYIKIANLYQLIKYLVIHTQSEMVMESISNRLDPVMYNYLFLSELLSFMTFVKTVHYGFYK